MSEIYMIGIEQLQEIVKSKSERIKVLEEALEIIRSGKSCLIIKNENSMYCDMGECDCERVLAWRALSGNWTLEGGLQQ